MARKGSLVRTSVNENVVHKDVHKDVDTYSDEDDDENYAIPDALTRYVEI